VKERERFRNDSYITGQVVEEGDTRLHRTDTSHKDPIRRIRTQLMEGRSQSDVTVEDV
jgi:hypothetical protein